jgi:hypothetical protein
MRARNALFACVLDAALPRITYPRSDIIGEGGSELVKIAG